MSVAEEHEAHELDGSNRRLSHSRDRDRSGELDRIAVDAGRDRGEGDRPAAELGCELERAPIARGEQLRLAVRSPVPDGPNRVDDVLRLELPRTRRLRVARLAAADETALREQLRTCRTVDRSVDAAAA